MFFVPVLIFLITSLSFNTEVYQACKFKDFKGEVRMVKMDNKNSPYHSDKLYKCSDYKGLSEYDKSVKK